MKATLKLSLAANVFLAVLAICLAAHWWTSAPPSRAQPAIPTVAEEHENPAQSPQSRSNAFHWSRIESTDYQTYISNLRSIGCPEQTIRDIIKADVHSLYAPRQQELERQQGTLEQSPAAARRLDRQSLELELQQLRDEEDSLVSTMVGPGSGGSEFNRPALSRPLRDRTLDRTVSVPLSFQSVDPADLKVDDRQRAVMAELRQKFQDDVGGPGQDRYDPAYRRRWQEAQRQNDDLFAGMLGGQFFLDYQLQATNPPSSTQ